MCRICSIMHSRFCLWPGPGLGFCRAGPAWHPTIWSPVWLRVSGEVWKHQASMLQVQMTCILDSDWVQKALASDHHRAKSWRLRVCHLKIQQTCPDISDTPWTPWSQDTVLIKISHELLSNAKDYKLLSILNFKAICFCKTSTLFFSSILWHRLN